MATFPTTPAVAAPVASADSVVDRARQITVTLSQALCLMGTVVGLGLLGGQGVDQFAGGALAADASLLAPAKPAFGVWTPIYAGLFLYTIWQWFPRVTVRHRVRATGLLAALSMLLNAVWLITAQRGWLWVSVVAIVGLIVVLAILNVILGTRPSRNAVETVVLDATFGLYLGWVCVAACANITAALIADGVRPGQTTATVLACGVLVVAAGVGVGLARRLGGRLAPALGMAWGLTWIAVGRSSAGPISAPVAVAAGLAAVAVLVATVVERRRSAR